MTNCVLVIVWSLWSKKIKYVKLIEQVKCSSFVNHFVHFDTDDTGLMNRIKTDTLITSADIPAIEELLTILCPMQDE